MARVAVVAPTTHICRQWALDAARYGLDLEPNRPNAAGPEPRDRHGIAVTYATLAAGPGVHRRRCAEAPTLLIADEPHHMGELAAWGRSTLAAFERARFRLLLSGTPFRSDNTPIPWVSYDDDGVSRADFALRLHGRAARRRVPAGDLPHLRRRDGVDERRPPPAGRLLAVLPAAEAARRLRTALDPDGDWVTHVLRDAHASLVELRAGAHPDAGGLVVAIDKEHAERLAARLGAITGERPAIVTSDAADASQRIQRFATGSGSWLVSVLMVSEGVDIPRLRVGVYATTARTELFFRQVVGRFIRRTPAPRQQMSHLFLPSDPALKRLAAQIEEERNHALSLEPEGEAVERGERGEPGEAFRALWSSARRDDDVLQTTQPGEALQLFAESRPRRRRRWPPSRRPSRSRRTSAASGCARRAARSWRWWRAPRARRTPRSTHASIAKWAPRRWRSRPSSSSSGRTPCSSARC